LGRRDHRRSHPLAGPPVRLTSWNGRNDQGGEHQGPWNPAHPARQPDSQERPRTEISTRPAPQATTSRARKIEASLINDLPQKAR
jgi:hypothetical protein